MRRRIPFYAMAILSGCGPMNNPFHDEYAHRPPTTTPSVEAAMAADVEPTVQERHGVEKVRFMEDGAVVHGPLWFEDPSEEHGSEDGEFRWTGEDYWWMVEWRARFLANLIALPGSAVMNPPWQRMASDGAYSCCGRGRQFDAERSCQH